MEKQKPDNASSSQSPQSPVDQQTPAALSADSETTREHTITIGGREYSTNLPAGVDVIFLPEGRDLEDSTIVPSGTDSLEPGRYLIHGMDSSGDFFSGGQNESERSIEILEGSHGKTISRVSFSRYARFLLSEDAEQLMQSVGFDVAEKNGSKVIAGVPTPETVKAACKLAGVEIKLLPEFANIPARVYVQAFADGQYPVATGDEGDYAHDIEDDHITAMVLGGEPLKKALAKAAQEALASGNDEAIKKITYQIDNFTATLRGVVSDCVNLLGEAYGQEMGWMILSKSGKELGLDDETILTILKEAQGNGQKLGLKVKQLRLPE